MTQKI